MANSSPHNITDRACSGRGQRLSRYSKQNQFLMSRMGTKRAPAFASENNRKCEKFASRFPQRNSWENALQMQWTRTFAYAFPLFPLILRVLNKMKREPCHLILITPAWPRQFWYTELLLCSISPHILFPPLPNLLSMNNSQIVHPQIRSLSLSAWNLTTTSSQI